MGDLSTAPILEYPNFWRELPKRIVASALIGGEFFAFKFAKNAIILLTNLRSCVILVNKLAFANLFTTVSKH